MGFDFGWHFKKAFKKAKLETLIRTALKHIENFRQNKADFAQCKIGNAIATRRGTLLLCVWSLSVVFAFLQSR